MIDTDNAILTENVREDTARIILLHLINYLAVFIVFSDALTWRGVFNSMEIRFSYFLIVLIFFLSIPFLKSVYFNKTFLLFLGLIALLSLYNVYLGKDTFLFLSKQIIGIFLSSFVFYLVIKINKYDVTKLFKIYLDFAFIVALIGIFQLFSYLVDFRMGYDFSYIFPSWRLSLPVGGLLKVNSIMQEPAEFCIAMMPAFFVSLTSFSKKNYRLLTKLKSLVIILSLFLSFSLVGYMGIVVSLFLFVYNSGKVKHIVIGVVLIISFMFFAYTNVSNVKMRVDDSIRVLKGEMLLEDSNLSTFTLFSNASVAFESFKENPVFGSGLGSHCISYSKYIRKFVRVDRVVLFLNMGDANSLFLRVLSETGIVGLLSCLYFIFKFYVRKKEENNCLWIINNAILAMFMIKLARSGHYFIGGFFFFMWLYYFSGKSSKCMKGQKGKNC